MSIPSREPREEETYPSPSLRLPQQTSLVLQAKDVSRVGWEFAGDRPPRYGGAVFLGSHIFLAKFARLC